MNIKTILILLLFPLISIKAQELTNLTISQAEKVVNELKVQDQILIWNCKINEKLLVNYLKDVEYKKEIEENKIVYKVYFDGVPEVADGVVNDVVFVWPLNINETYIKKNNNWTNLGLYLGFNNSPCIQSFTDDYLESQNIGISNTKDEFKYVTSSTSGNEVYVLFEKDNYGIKEFWLKMTEPVKTTKNKSGKLIKTGGGYTLEYIKMNCSEKEYSSSDAVKYDKNGNATKRPEYYDTYDEKIIPNSVMSGVYKYICE